MKFKLNKLFSELPPVVQVYSIFFIIVPVYLIRYFFPYYINKRAFLGILILLLLYYLHFRGVSALKKVGRAHAIVWAVIALFMVLGIPSIIQGIVDMYKNGELFTW